MAQRRVAGRSKKSGKTNVPKKPSLVKLHQAKPELNTVATADTLPHSVSSSQLAAGRWARLFFVTAGFISLALGIIGVVTPILPTTPFILLSGFCFARGSERFHVWLMQHRYFGPMIRAFRDEKRIPLKAKIFATVMIIVTMTATALVVKKVFAIVAMASVGVAVITYIWTFKH